MQPASRWQKARPWLKLGLVATLTLCLFLLLVVFALLGTSPGRSVTAGLIHHVTRSENQIIEINAFDQALGGVKIGSVTIADADGIWLEAKGFDFAYSLSDLLALRLRSDHLTLSELIIRRAPKGDDTSPPNSSDAPLIPNVPAIRAHIDRIAIDKIALGKSLLGKAAVLSLSGHLTMDDQPMHASGHLALQHQGQARPFVKANWDFLPHQNRRQITLALNEPRGGLAARLLDMADLPAINMSLQGDGPADAWTSNLSISLDGAEIVKGALNAQLTRQSKRLQAVLQGNLAPFAPESIVPLVAGTSDFSIIADETDGVLTLSELRFTSALSQMTGTGQINLAKEELDLSTRFDLGRDGVAVTFPLSDQAPILVEPVALAMRLQGPFSGAQIRAQATAARLSQGAITAREASIDIIGSNFNLRTGQGRFTATAELTSLTTGTEQADKALAGPLTLKTNIDLGDHGISLTDSRFDSRLLAVALSGTIGTETLALEGQAQVSALEQIEPQAKGALLARFRTSGSLAKPVLKVDLTGRDVAVAGEAVQDLTLALTADTTPNLSLLLSAQYQGSPLSVTSDVISQSDGAIAIQDLTVTAPSTKIAGAIKVAPDGLAVGALDVKIDALAKLAPFLLQPDLSGSIDGKLMLDKQSGKQSIALKAKAPTIRLPGVRVANLQLDASLFDPMGTPATRIGLRVDQLSAGGETLRALDAKMEGSGGRLPFSLRTNLSGQTFNMAGLVLQSDGMSSVFLDQLQGRWKGIAIKLTDATRIDLSDGARFVNPLRLSIDGGRATLSGSATDTIDLTLKLQTLPLSIADKVASTGEAITGALSMDARVTGASSNPLVQWNGQVSGLSTRTLRNTGTPPLGIQTEGQFQGTSILSKSRLTGGGADLSIAGLVALEPQRLDLNVKGKVPFVLAAKALADAGIRLDGNAVVDAKVTGAPTAPDIAGLVSMKGARLIELASGVVIRDLSGRVALGGQQAKLDTISGRLGKDGTLSLQGTIGLDPQQSLPADIRLTVRNGAFKHEDILATQFNADLALKGALAGSSALTGQINLTKTEISIPESLPGSLSPVAVNHRNATGKIAKQADKFKPKSESSSTQSSPISLNLLIASPRRIYVRGRGLDAELGGTIRIIGDSNNPNPVGSVSLQRGRMDLLSRRLDFDTGIVTFAGSLDPALDFSATTSNSDATYTLSVGGYASAPEISLSSSPSLPQDEIVAQIFFNENIADLSALQLAQLANAVATLSGVNSGPGLVDRLRDMAGIDNIDVKSDEETGETTVGVGSYLNERTYINVEKGTNSNSGKVTIDLDITNQLKARGEADTTGKSKAGIFFERDY